MTDYTSPDPHDRAGPAPEVQARLHDLLDGRLDEADAAAVRALLARDPAAREAWDDLLRVQASVRAYGPQGADLEVPEDFLARVNARIQAERASTAAVVSPHGPGRMLRIMTLAYAAAALLVVGFTLRYVLVEEQTAPASMDTAKESLDRRVPEEALGAVAPEDRPQDGFAPPADGMPDHGARPTPRTRAQPDAESTETPPRPTEAPAPDSSLAGGGPFGAPGGAVRPGMRAPSTEAKLPVEEPAPAREALGLLLAAADAGEVVYVLEVADAAAARRELAAVLGPGPNAAVGKLEGRAGPPEEQDAEAEEVAEQERLTARHKRAPAEGLTSGAGAKAGSVGKDKVAAPPARLYRVDAAAARRLAETLAVAPAPMKKARADSDDEARDARTAPRLAVLEWVTREIDAQAAARLEQRAVAGSWDEARAKERGAVQPAPPPIEAPAPPAAPARRQRPREPAPGADAPAPAADAGAPLAPASPDPKEPARPVRVRILLLERK